MTEQGWARALCDAITGTPRYRVGSFALALANAALVADGSNRRLLSQGFPGLVMALEAWERIGFDYLEALADGDEGALKAAYLEYQERSVADHERWLAESGV